VPGSTLTDWLEARGWTKRPRAFDDGPAFEYAHPDYAGRIGLIAWTPGGFIGQMFATMKPYVAPPPPGAQPPPLWGDVAHVRELFGDRVTDLRAGQQLLRAEGMADAEAFREYFKQHYGPTVAAYRGLADTPERAAELDQALDELVDRFRNDDGTIDWEYLLVTATVV